MQRVRAKLRTQIGDPFGMEGEEGSLLVQRQRRIKGDVPSVPVRQQGFGSGRLPAHRAPGHSSEQKHKRVFRYRRNLGTEGTADIRRNNPQILAGDPQDGRQLAAQVMRRLVAGCQGVAARSRIERPERVPVLHRIGADAGDVETNSDTVRGRGDHLQDPRLIADCMHEAAVIRQMRPNRQRIRRQEVARAGDGWFGRIGDDNGLGRQERIGGVSATTATTGNPTWVTRSRAKRGNSGSAWFPPSAPRRVISERSPAIPWRARSSPVSTATTPGLAAAGAVSIDRIRAFA